MIPEAQQIRFQTNRRNQKRNLKKEGENSSSMLKKKQKVLETIVLNQFWLHVKLLKIRVN